MLAAAHFLHIPLMSSNDTFQPLAALHGEDEEQIPCRALANDFFSVPSRPCGYVHGTLLKAAPSTLSTLP